MTHRDALDLKSARARLGLSVERFAAICQLGSARTVRRWEMGELDVPGPVRVLVNLMLRSAEVRKLLGISASPPSASPRSRP